MNEITFVGVETMQSEDNEFSCDAKAIVGEQETELNSVHYKGYLTSKLESISPRYGSVEGGTVVTFTGENFDSNTALYKITLDGIDCPVSAATDTSVTCTTGGRPGLHDTKTEIYIEGKGSVAMNDLVFTYASAWSADSTWGGEIAPMEGESISIPPGLNLLVDIDRSPLLNIIIV
jgi:hypothetical protein